MMTGSSMRRERNIPPRRGRTVRRAGALLVAALLWLSPAANAETPITLLDRYVGNTNYAATGGSFRTAPNTSNACALTPTSTANLTGIPATATIRAVYLYWVGSGAALDSQVTLNGTTVTASRTDTATFPFGGNSYQFFSGFAEISAQNIVTGDGSYSLSSLNVTSGGAYCNVQVVVAGWALYVVYDDPASPLHAVNVFDGFQLFRGSAISLTASGFRIPPSFISGRFTFAHYEGDPQNSQPINGFAEALSLNGTALDDGIVPPASNPLQQPYDGTVNGQGIANSHGVDVDTYDVTSLLSSGDTSATVTMSAGGDLVLSTGMIIAVNTEPVVDLGVTATHVDTFVPGQTGELLLDVDNGGPEADANDIDVTLTLPAGLSYASVSGGSWVCTPVAGTVTCTHPGPLAAGAALPQLAVALAVDAAARGSLTVDVAVSSASLDTNGANDQTSETVTIATSDLSGSTKSVVDPNGGDADPLDTLRYTIRLTESGGIAAAGVRVTDDVPLNIESFTVVSLPGGASDNSSATGGAFGNGFIDIDNVSVAAGGSVDIVVDMVIAAATAPGQLVSNTAVIDNPPGIGATAVAPDVTVSASAATASGTKTLYLYDTATADPNGADNGPRPYLSRTPPAAPQGNVRIDKTQPPVAWRLTPALPDDLRIAAGSLPVTLYVSKGGGGGGSVQRTLTVAVADSVGAVGAPVTLSFAAPPSTAPAAVTFSLPLAAERLVTAGETLTLTATNVTPGGGNRRIRVFPISAGNFSRVEFDALTVINVDSVTVFDAAFPGGSAVTTAAPGSPLSIRATVSDPFGSFDIASVSAAVVDDSGTVVVADAPLTRVADSGGATADFELLYTLPAGAGGDWTFDVTAVEGTEGTVTHSRSTVVSVTPPLPGLVIGKTVTTESDPVNGSGNPFNVPGAIVYYTITVTNTAGGQPDAGTLTIRDAIPANTRFVASPASAAAVEFADGAVASGLGFDVATDVAYSSQPGGAAPYDYLPSAGADGTDPAVTGLEIVPSGTMNASSGAGDPSFSVTFRVMVEN